MLMFCLTRSAQRGILGLTLAGDCGLHQVWMRTIRLSQRMLAVPRRRDSHAARKRPRIPPLAYVLCAFVLARLAGFLLGVRFDTGSLGHYWQFIDPQLLRTNLLESLYYLHSQPPLFNLFLGIVVKLSGGHEAFTFHVIFIAFGLTLSISLYLVMTNLGLPDKLSSILTIIFVASPSCLLYEDFLFYTYPIAAVLCLSALVLHRYLKFGRFRHLAIFFALLASLVLTRSIFHLIWFVVLTVPLIWLGRNNWKKIALAAGVPFLLCFLLYVKNAHEFGSFSSSTWFGMNFARLTTWRLPLSERYKLIGQGKISTLSVVKPFRKLETYQRHSHVPLADSTGISVLDQTQKSTGAPNLNNLTYINISRQYLQDALYVLPRYPGTYLGSLFESLLIYFVPTSSYSFLKDNREMIGIVDRVYNLILCGQLQYEKEITDDRTFFNTGLLTALGYLVVIVYGFLLVRQALRRKPVNFPNALTLLFIWLNLVYVTTVGNAFELGENNRFRFVVDPLFLILLGIALKRRFKKPAA